MLSVGLLGIGTAVDEAMMTIVGRFVNICCTGLNEGSSVAESFLFFVGLFVTTVGVRVGSD
jgi:hypothetical protein